MLAGEGQIAALDEAAILTINVSPPSLAVCHAATLQYTKTAAAVGAAAAKCLGREAVAPMKAMAVEDDAFG